MARTEQETIYLIGEKMENEFTTDKSKLCNLIKKLCSDYTNGYGPKPIPVTIDEQITQLLKAITKNSSLREVLANQMVSNTPRLSRVFIAYAERMTAYAVRKNDIHFLEFAMFALTLASGDSREIQMLFPLFFHSCKLLGLDAEKFFTDSSAYFTSKQLQNEAKTFPSRFDNDKSLKAMGYEIIQKGGSIRYSRTW